MKVEEAKTKVCPFIQNMAILISTLPIKTDRDFVNGVKENHHANIKCISTDCMAWVSRDKQEVKSITEGYCARIGQ